MKTPQTEQQAINLIQSQMGYAEVIGTDASIAECVREGYLMMKKVKLTGNIDLHFFSFTPDYILAENGKTEPELMTNTELSLNYLLEKYSVHKKGIDSFADCNYSLKPNKYKDCHTVLALADVVNAYCGLD